MQIQPLLSTAALAPAISPHGGARRPERAESPAAVSTRSDEHEDSLEISDEALAALVQLEPEEQQQVEELRQRDHEVRAHEQAHLAAAGPYALGGPTYEYQQGPDGNRYAVGGEVQIDASPVEGDPEATIRKARVIRAAALAAAEPSAQDQAVAAAASLMESKARAEVTQQGQRTDQADDLSATSTDRESDLQAEERGLVFDALA